MILKDCYKNYVSKSNSSNNRNRTEERRVSGRRDNNDFTWKLLFIFYF